jgi:hypothetical protein
MALVNIGSLSCIRPHPYETNPNLKLVVGDTVYHSTHNFNPVVSPNGGKVHYLSISVDNWSGFYEDQMGSLFSVNTDGSDILEILPGKYNNIAASPDGKKLAAQSYKGEYDEPIPESLIVILHMDTGNAESLWVTSRHIKKLAWSNNGNYLYYHTSNSIYRLYLPDSTDEIVMSISGIVGFDLFNNDSIYLDSVIWCPEIDPINQQHIIGSSGIFAINLLMRDIQGETLITFPDSLTPYCENWVG